MNRSLPASIFLALLAFTLGSATHAQADDASPDAIENIASPILRAAPDLVLRRNRPLTALLPDGRVMIAGGQSIPTTTASIEIYDPTSGTLSQVGSLAQPRESAVVTPLPNGLVLIAGGANRAGGGISHSSAELFDPVSLQSNAINPMAFRREWAVANLLPNGMVLIAGGIDYGEESGPDAPDPLFGLKSAELYNPLTGAFAATGSMSIDRFSATSVTLADGRVLVIGGSSFNGGPLATSEIYNPATGQFGNLATLPGGARDSPIALLLTDGKVLVAGGSSYQASALLYNPITNSYATTGSMSTGRAGASATLMADGSALIIGGQSARYVATTAIDRYNPATGTFAAVANLSTARSNIAVSLLPDGRILAAGGYVPPPNNNQGGQILAKTDIIDPRGITRADVGGPLVARSTALSTVLADGRVLHTGGGVAASELFSPVTNAFTATGSMAQARQNATINLMPDGSAVVIGGEDANGNVLASAERFDPHSNAFASTTRPLWQARSAAASALLPDGKLLVIGGRNAVGPLASAEIYDGHTRQFRTTAALATARSEASAVTLPNGLVLVAGGRATGTTTVPSAELYDPQLRSFSPTGNLATARRNAITALLPNGKVLIAGGQGSNGAALASAELYDPTLGTFSATGAMPGARADTKAIVTPDGRVVIEGGGGGPLAYDPWRGVFEAIPANAGEAQRRGVALLPDGRVLAAARPGATGSATLTAAHSGVTVAATARPLLSTTPALLQLPAALEVEGTGLRGSRRLGGAGSLIGSEANGGVSSSAVTNFPLLRLQRVDNQHVILQSPDPFLPWTDLVFTTPTLARFDPWNPDSRMAGTYRVSVIANGIESTARYVSFYWIEDSIFASGFQAGD